MTEETVLGPCEGEVAAAPSVETSTEPEIKQAPVGKSDCRQYVAVIGKTIQVPCSKK
jgi:hypothetical protein